MRTALIDTNGIKAKLGGYDHFWSTILAKTSEDSPTFTYHDIDYACSPGFESVLRKFLGLLQKNGFIEVAQSRTSAHNGHVYRLLIRQRATPSFTRSGGLSRLGDGQQNMWNVIRRKRQGFTVEQLHIDASTDDITVSLQAAKDYCRRLAKVGVLVIQKPGKRGVGRNAYVLRGSADTGPKPPGKYQAHLIIDHNTGMVLGNAEAIEVTP